MDDTSVKETSDTYYTSQSVNSMLSKISSHFDIDLLQIEQIRDTETSIDKSLLFALQTKTNKTGLCLARKQDGEQCTRKCRDGTHFCGKHINSHKYGCVNDDLISDSDSIQIKSEIHEGKKVMVDSDGIVYQYTDNNNDSIEIIGRKNLLGRIILIEELESQSKYCLLPKTGDLMSMMTKVS